MSRRRSAIRRNILPDAKYGNVTVAKFINTVMKNGKKTVAEKAVYSALEEISKKLGMDPIEALEKALENVRPVIEVRSRRVGGATYQVPCEIRPVRALALAFRWVINASLARKDKNRIADRIAAELLDAVNNKGGAVKKREDTHKMAEANKAFAHFNW